MLLIDTCAALSGLATAVYVQRALQSLGSALLELLRPCRRSASGTHECMCKDYLMLINRSGCAKHALDWSVCQHSDIACAELQEASKLKQQLTTSAPAFWGSDLQVNVGLFGTDQKARPSPAYDGLSDEVGCSGFGLFWVWPGPWGTLC